MRTQFLAISLLVLLVGSAAALEKKPANLAQKSVSQLLKGLADKDSDVRAEAAEALGKLGRPPRKRCRP